MLRDWLAAAFLCTVLLLVVHLVSFVVLWFALPAVGSACLLLAMLFSVLFIIIAPDLRVLLAVLVNLLCYFVLLTTGSLVVVLSRILTTCFSAVVPSVFLSHHWLFVCGSACASFSESLCGRLRLRGSSLASLQHHYSALRPS